MMSLPLFLHPAVGSVSGFPVPRAPHCLSVSALGVLPPEEAMSVMPYADAQFVFCDYGRLMIAARALRLGCSGSNPHSLSTLQAA